jgi:hypothetical protein
MDNYWTERMKRNRFTVAAGVLLLLAGFVLALSFYDPQKAVFKRLVQKPVPESVKSLEVGRRWSMDAAYFVLKFQINKADLHQILKKDPFAPIDEDKEFAKWDTNSERVVPIQKVEYLQGVRKQIRDVAGLHVDFATNCQIYSFHEGHGEKYIFCTPDRDDVVFIARTDPHVRRDKNEGVGQ